MFVAGNSLCLPKASQPCSRGNKVFPSTQSCLSTGLSSRSETLRRWRWRHKCCNSVRGLLIRWVATISFHLSALPKVADRTLRLYCRKGGLTSLKLTLLYFLPTDWVEQDRQTTQNNLRSEKNTKTHRPLIIHTCLEQCFDTIPLFLLNCDVSLFLDLLSDKAARHLWQIRNRIGR